MSSEPHREQAPWRLSGYVVSNFLGRGGFGEVWSGRVKSTGRAVALKRISVTDAAERKAARIEAAMMSSLEHPNLLGLHEVISTRNQIVLVMDLAAQGSLRDLLSRRSRLTPGEVTYLISAVANAVSYAHNVGVIHGDITPGNILFNSLATPLLADLGVARIVDEFAPVVVTAPYIDPAVAAGAPPGKPSDVFMLAATAFHCLTGQPLWHGTDQTAVQAARSAQPGFAKELLAAYPSPIGQVIERALSPEPACRPSATELALDLRASCAPVPVDLDVGRSRRPKDAVRAQAAGGAHRRPVESDDVRRPASARAGAWTVLSRAANPGPPAVPIGRRRRAVATLRYRRPKLLRILTVALPIVAISAWYAQSVSRSSGSVLPGAVQQRPAATSQQPDPSAESSDESGGNLGDTLRRIDAVREHAYATNDPSLLTQVYLPGTLLEQDARTMTRLIPAGCVLQGLHTTYTDLGQEPGAQEPGAQEPGAQEPDRQEPRSEGTVSLVVTASLPSSTLRCPDGSAKQLAGRGPTRLRITLVDDGHAYRLSGQQVV